MVRTLDNYSCHRYTYNRSMAPLTPAVAHVLLALAGGERHGYAIIKDVQRQSGSRLRFGPGTIYSTLQRLTEAGWVEAAAPRARTDERRRYYRLTHAGREALKAEIDRLGELLAVARAHRIQPRGSRG
jgi:DNA-binding PadR family transcriptional regulator